MCYKLLLVFPSSWEKVPREENGGHCAARGGKFFSGQLICVRACRVVGSSAHLGFDVAALPTAPPFSIYSIPPRSSRMRSRLRPSRRLPSLASHASLALDSIAYRGLHPPCNFVPVELCSLTMYALAPQQGGFRGPSGRG